MSDQGRIVDYKQTEIGCQNWEVCARMLAHDLVDLAERNAEVRELCEFYSITVLENGAHTMALPRKELLKRKQEAQARMESNSNKGGTNERKRKERTQRLLKPRG